ncbi:MAG: glycine cleavage system protein GcvH [Chlamydiae bacterium]|nr:glycine cleavage system protein GcvH [Chlamydiota bacterium]MBI3267023.1 glycine cleavage system protein GcvH [Chlamydiota bacterium]
MNVPKDLKYSKTHEWVRSEKGEGVVGITDFAQHELGDVVFVELPKVGQKLKAEDSCAVVESVKAASDIYAPLSGTVLRVNESLAKDTSVVNKDPYDSGWFFVLQLDPHSLATELLSAQDYQRLIGVEA